MIYEPQEDSYLMQRIVKEFAKGKVLEIGTGSGILAGTAAQKKEVESVFAVDINPHAVEYSRLKYDSTKIRFRISDLFSHVKGKYDTIIFNPPYLPEDRNEDEESSLTTTGGKKGHEIIERFLNMAGEHMNPDGEILLLFSTLTGIEKIDQLVADNLFESENIAELKIAFETLYVDKIKKNVIRKELEEKGIHSFKKYAQGHRGKIYTGLLGGKKVAVKIQRSDKEAQGTVGQEANVLQELNKEGIGPKLILSGKDYFVSEFVEGKVILDYLSDEGLSREKVVNILKDLCEQMYKLDKLNYNKEEMHRPLKHVIIDEKDHAVLIDFERCRKREKTHNVTQFTQFLLSGHMQPYRERFNIAKNTNSILEQAKEYAEQQTREHLEKLMSKLFDA